MYFSRQTLQFGVRKHFANCRRCRCPSGHERGRAWDPLWCVCVCVWRVPCSKRQILTGRVYKHTGNGSQAERHDHSDKYSSNNNNNKGRGRTMRASRTTTTATRTTMTTLPIYRSKIVRPCKFCMRKHLTPFSLKQCKQAATQLDASSACQGAATHQQQLTGETAHQVSR